MRQRLKLLVQKLLVRMGYTVRKLSPQEINAFMELQRPDEKSFDDVFGNRSERLLELRRRYAAVDSPAAVHSVWAHRQSKANLVSTGLAGVDLTRFRASSSYVWNYYGLADAETERLKYFVFQQSVRANDTNGLLDTLSEDGAFGCPTFEFPSLAPVSRDLLDSVAEINFLQRHLGVLDRVDVRVLDIGAGYGRMAHRLLDANPGMTGYTCVDAVPESTFLCEFYLEYRGLAERADVIPLDEVDERLDGPFDVALNIHSFSECTYEAVEWWLQRVQKLGIPNLMIVPNPDERFQNDSDRFIASQPDGSKRNYLPLLAELGYEQVARESLVDDTARSVLGVDDVMFLFKLRTAS
ncbi:MAG: putative sugar O-methyltransferase [Aeromicrobium sp.]